jgi:hypothetical protein
MTQRLPLFLLASLVLAALATAVAAGPKRPSKVNPGRLEQLGLSVRVWDDDVPPRTLAAVGIDVAPKPAVAYHLLARGDASAGRPELGVDLLPAEDGTQTLSLTLAGEYTFVATVEGVGVVLRRDRDGDGIFDDEIVLTP